MVALLGSGLGVAIGMGMHAHRHTRFPIHGHQGAHDLFHVRVAVIHEGFHEVRDWPADVAKMNLPELVHFGEGARVFKHILPHLLAAFHPGSRTQTDANVGTVGDFQRPCVAIEVPEDATRHSAQLRHRRIIRMDADAHSQFFRNGDHLPDEISVVLPKLFLAVPAAVGERAGELGIATYRSFGSSEPSRPRASRISSWSPTLPVDAHTS